MTHKPACEHCGDPLALKRAWRTVVFRCTGCSAEYPLARFIHLMDDAMEQQLAGLRCDRV